MVVCPFNALRPTMVDRPLHLIEPGPFFLWHPNQLPLPVPHNPAAHQVRVDPVRQGHGSHRRARHAALLNDLELILPGIGPASGAVDAHPTWPTRLGVRHLHSGHHLYGRSRQTQDGLGRTLTLHLIEPGPFFHCGRSGVGENRFEPPRRQYAAQEEQMIEPPRRQDAKRTITRTEPAGTRAPSASSQTEEKDERRLKLIRRSGLAQVADVCRRASGIA